MADGQSNGALVKAPISAGGNVSAILAHSFEDAWRIGGVMAESGLTPFKRQEEACAAIMAGGEVGLPPFASLQSFMYVNGRLAMWGDAQLALVRSRGHRVEEWYEGALAEGTLTAFTKVTRCDTGEIILESFSIDEAKRAGLWQTQETVKRKSKDGGWYDAKNDSPWFRYQKRMLRYRARGFALRDGCSDVLRGIKMVEEVRDYPEESVEARIIDQSGDNEQRPADERVGKYGVIGGAPARDIYDDLAQRMSDSVDGADLEIVFDEAEKANLSQNRMFALAEHYEACKDAHDNGKPLPAPPRFTDAPEPSPFEALKKQGEAVTDARSLSVFASALTPEVLGRCTAEERAELQTLYRSKKSNPAGSAAGKKDEDANAASNGDGAPGGTSAGASSSVFEDLKKNLEAIRQVKGKRRQGAALHAWQQDRDAAKYDISDIEAADLKAIEAEIAKEIA